MDEHDLDGLLAAVGAGDLAPGEAAARIRSLRVADLGFARIDHHRELRQGMPEAIYGPHKTPEQCAAIVRELLSNGTGPVILTRADPEQVEAALSVDPSGTVTEIDAKHGPFHLVSWRHRRPEEAAVLLVTAGTADLPPALECAAVLDAHGITPTLRADCGVAGIHRVLALAEELLVADGVVVFAGMEGALASVIGGLTPAPVIAVPTSAGYGAGLEGVTALLAMHASCAAGVSVVGIDNGFGAACAIVRVLHAIGNGK